MRYALNYSGTRFCPLKIKITQFPGRFRLKLRLSRPQIWNTEQEKDREKRKSGRPAKLNEKKGHRDLEREIKNKGDIFLLEQEDENFTAAVIK